MSGRMTSLLLTCLVGGAAAAMDITAENVERYAVYHSPQTPGYTCWTGAWLMPDGTPMVCFHQAMGPFTGRPLAPKAVRDYLNWPPAGHPEAYDMSKTTQEVITLRGDAEARKFKVVGREPFSTPMNGFACMAQLALPDGRLLRAVIGQYLPFYDVPRTGYTQQSSDLGQTWSAPQRIMADESLMTYPIRLRALRDGRLAVLGALIPLADDIRCREDWMRVMKPALWLSRDGGESWSAPILTVIPQPGLRYTEEQDCAELDNGDLIVIHRIEGQAQRHQSILTPEGEGFRVASQGFCSLPAGGHPELLALREGPVLYSATSGIAWTDDHGTTWHDLGIGGTSYYPRSIQLRDGRIFCVGHTGGDDPYDGSRDQAITALSFSLRVAP